MDLQDLTSQIKKKVDSMKAKAPKEPAAPKQSLARPHKEPERLYIDIKSSTVVRIVLVIIGLLYLAQVVVVIGDILLMLLMSVIVASALGPTVDRWHAKGMNRVAAAIIVYLLILAVLTVIISSFVPVVGNQVMDLASNITSLLSRITSGIENDASFFPRLQELVGGLDREEFATQVQSQLQTIGSSLVNVAGNVWGAVGAIFGGLLSFVTVLILSFYMVIQKHSFGESLAALVPSRYEPYVIEREALIRLKLGAWLRGQLTVCSLIASMALVGLVVLQVPYALTLALFAGLMAIVPFLGPLLGAIPSILIAFTVSPWVALFVAILYFVVIQFFESNIITPLVMRKAVGLNPVSIIAVLLIGGRLFGILGVILAIPVTTALKVFVKDIHRR